MDPIEKLNAMPKKIMINKDNIVIKGEPLKGINSSSQENFFRKTGKQFGLIKGDSYGTIIQIMKSDLSQIQEMINDYSYITKMFKLSSKTTLTSKKINEIDEGRDIKAVLDKIIEDSSSAEKFGKLYSCQNGNDLILKMGLELNLYEAFIKKLNELFFVLNLKINGEENSISIGQESFSKFFVIKLVLEKMIERSSNTYVNDTDTSLNNYLMNNSQNNFNKKKSISDVQKNLGGFNNNIEHDEKNRKIDEYEKIRLINNINELLNLDGGPEDDDFAQPLIKHICTILKEFLGKLGSGYADLLTKYSTKKDIININQGFSNISMENLFSQKLLIEKLLSEKDKLINNQNFNITSIPNSNQDVQTAKLNEEKKKIMEDLEKLKAIHTKSLSEIKNLSDKINDQKLQYEEELKKLKQNTNSGKDSSKDVMNPYVIDENIISKSFQESIDKKISSVHNENIELITKLEEFKTKYQLLNKEYEDLKVKFEFVSKKIKKESDFESYEELLQEQFDNMKSAFMVKIEELNSELNKNKVENRKKIYMLEEDLNQTKNVKELLLKKLTDLQRLINPN